MQIAAQTRLCAAQSLSHCGNEGETAAGQPDETIAVVGGGLSRRQVGGTQ